VSPIPKVLYVVCAVFVFTTGPSRGEEAAMESRSKAIESALATLRQSIEPSTKAELYFVLGKLRADCAVDVLVNDIAFEAPSFQGDAPKRPGSPPWGRHPVVDALVEIGVAAVPALLRNLESTDDIQARDLSAWAMRRILHQLLGENTEHDDGRFLSRVVMERAIDRQHDPQKRARLQAAVKRYGA